MKIIIRRDEPVSDYTGNLFQPGNLPGDFNPQIAVSPHAYSGWYVAPQPSIGLAWTPGFKDGILGKITGEGKTVIRAGYSLRRFTEPQQYFWNQATDYGACISSSST